MAEAETGVMELQAQEHRGLLVDGTDPEGPDPADTLILDF